MADRFSQRRRKRTYSVNMVRHHPLLPEEVPVHGLVIDPGTGTLDVVVDGYETVKGGCS